MKISVLTCLLSLLLGFTANGAASAAEKPNILLILADDMGWSDLGCYGADLHETPHIDRLAGESVRFIQAYAMSVCSPSRAALLTGKHAARLHYTIWSEGAMSGGPKNRKLLEAESIWNLPREERTLASRLRDAGYLTALVGKWHLGDWEHYPETHGFEINIGGTNWGAPQSFHWPYSGTGRFGAEYRYVPHLEYGKPGEYLTDRLTEEAMQVVDRAGDRPFFIYLAHHAVHTPIEPRQEDIAHFEGRLREGMHHRHVKYAAMMKNLDDNVGRILEHLKRRGRDRDTVVIFVSDNGGYVGKDKWSGSDEPVTNNAPLRSGKGSLYEGGIRVPLIIRWPGVSKSGSVCQEPVILMDLFQTLLGAAGIASADHGHDGLDLAPLLKDPSSRLDRDALFFHYPHYYHTTTPASAVRARDWKLVEYFEDNRAELYHVSEDISEQQDLAAEMPEKVVELRGLLHAWRESAGAALPRPNPDFKAPVSKPGKSTAAPSK